VKVLSQVAIYLAVGAAAWAALGGLIGAQMRSEQLTRIAENALKAAALALCVAAFGLFYAFLTHDFSIAYVAEYSNREMNTLYTFAAFWAGQPGSLLLWAWVLSIYGAVVVIQNRVRNRNLMPWVTTVLGFTLFIFTTLMAFMSNPFVSLAVAPADGTGLNPLLRNPYQLMHPVTLYMGYVGLTIPFAFCIAALATGNLSDVWIRTVRKWALWAWLLLTVGIILGARWAYVELGWGGYWAWDPVENASIIPWFMVTAYLHSVMIQEKRGMLKVWNVFLIVAAFAMSVFGTFLTRSGVISSVHAFAESNVGPFLIATVTLTVLVSGILIAWRLPELRGSGKIDSVVSREGVFLVNNLVLVAMGFAIFWGTVFPLVAEAVRGVKVSVGVPWYQTIITPMAVLLLALVGICPLLGWRKASGRQLRRNFIVPAVGMLAAAVVLAVFAKGQHLRLVLILGLTVFVFITISIEFARGIRARMAVREEKAGLAFYKLFTKNPRRYGGYVIHIGVVILMVGIALNYAYKSEVNTSLKVGESAKVGGYVLTLKGLQTETTADKQGVIASIAVSDASTGKSLGIVKTERSMYLNQDQPATEVGIRSTPVEDLYLIVQSADTTQQVGSFAFLVNPGVFWIWVGALVLLVGGLVVAWPRRQAKRETTEVERETRETVPVA
jgi:cytochrome c-type biogenesis protein CcmF